MGTASFRAFTVPAAERTTFLWMMSYLCDLGFTVVTVIKKKKKKQKQRLAKINVEQEMRVAGSNQILRFQKLGRAQQTHTSQ